jgi:hypothetical protein
VRIVVNHLRLKEPLTEAVIEAADDVTQRIVDAGGLAASLVQVDGTHAILVLTFPDPETEERIKSGIGGPWMREHIIPLLEGPTERHSGEAVAASG